MLDVNVLMNDDTIINLEMQMQDFNNWTDRALSYTCRNFTHLQKGYDYTDVQPVIHIGFLDYTLFPEYPEFHATYMLQNVKNHQVFSSKIRIDVVNLNQLELATEEDKFYGINQWVALFKSKTWEDLRMIANEKPELLEASKSLYEYNNETTIRYQCYAREDYRKMMNTIRRTEKEQTERLEQQSQKLEEQSRQLEKNAKKLAEQEAYIKELESQLAKLNKN